jgi:hypothetical protein
MHRGASHLFDAAQPAVSVVSFLTAMPRDVGRRAPMSDLKHPRRFQLIARYPYVNAQLFAR